MDETRTPGYRAVAKQIRDATVLKSPRLSLGWYTTLFGALTWPNGFDLDPILVHDRMAVAGELGREAVD
jgi:hypothetical protein